HVEDHPLDYADFRGTIPEGYGAGTVETWDRGTWEPIGADGGDYAKGRLKFTLHGSRLKGGWALVRMGGARNADGKNWLLIKERDAAARAGDADGVIERAQRSVVSRRSMDGIAKAGDRVWHSTKRPTAMLARAQRLEERARSLRALPGPGAAIEGARPAKLPAVPQAELATLVEAPPEGAGWLHEIKYDGYRMLARLDRGAVRMFSRNGKDWSGRFPEIEAALTALPVESAVLDGEVVHLLPNGLSSFTALKDDLSAKRTAHLVYFLFDVPYLDGRSLERSPLRARKAALAAILADASGGPVRLSEHVAGDGRKFFDAACKHGLEGIVSKRADAPYRALRTRDWVKVKCLRSDEFLVLGWTDPEGKRSGFGALLLGYHDGTGALRFAGGVGTGFTARSLAAIRRQLDRLARKTAPSPEIAKAAPRGAHWVAPELVAQVRFSEWTADGLLRHPSFQGLREDKEAAEVVLEPPRPAAAPDPAPVRPAGSARGQTEIAGVRITHPDKLLYPDAGITKRDLAAYYLAVADHMLPHVRGRPLTLVRCPEGAAGKCFYQKHPGDSAPPRLRRIEITEKEGTHTYLVADDAAGLVALVQMGALEIHLWGSTEQALEQPDRVIFDLDPDEGLAWERVSAGALAMRDLLAELGLKSFAKTTGGKGLHVVLPLRPRLGWDEIKAFAHGMAEELVRRAPDRFTGALPKTARRGKIFVDYLRNQRGATAIAPFSSRARADATVAAPLTWREVESGTRADAFSVLTLPDRLKRQRRDPWAGLADLDQSLPDAAMRLLRK
ncbi:MAG TPA: DNA ligase D, partial [Stellaceae bacterium]|nr:DNA ligase D [Stellaceae bacterium]